MKILSFGEILWDEFITQNQVTHKEIGGAPFNFAAHCGKNGAESYVMTAIGNDENGIDALTEVKRLGIHTDYISVLDNYKTGACRVTLQNGIPSYNLLTDVAYDHIPKANPSHQFDGLYMGTLAMRNEESKNSFRNLLTTTVATEVFFDVNLRGDFYSKELIDELLSYTTILKISDEEIGFFGSDNETVCKDLASRFPNLKYICVTLGKDGAFVMDCREKQFCFSEKPKSKAVSTVGAGDSFAAAFFVSLLSGYSVKDCLARGVALSDFVVTQMGAIPDYDSRKIFSNL